MFNDTAKTNVVFSSNKLVLVNQLCILNCHFSKIFHHLPYLNNTAYNGPIDLSIDGDTTSVRIRIPIQKLNPFGLIWHFNSKQ